MKVFKFRNSNSCCYQCCVIPLMLAFCDYPVISSAATITADLPEIIPATVLRSVSLHSITQENCNASSAAFQAGNQPIKIKWVNCSIPILPNGMFEHSPKTILLHISNNGLTTIQPWSLNGMRLLESLTITGNSITEVNRWSEHYFNALHSLDLHGNRIALISGNAIKSYPNIRTLRLDQNLIRELPDYWLANSTALTVIQLDGNLLTSISGHDFNGLTRLKQLSLNANMIKFIHPDAFRSNTEMAYLRLDGNRLHAIDTYIRHNLPQLVYLNVSHNEIKVIPAQTFYNNEQLVNLDLSYNELSDMQKDWALGLQALQVLNVSNNQIESIYPTFGEQLLSLKLLNIAGNKIQRLFDNAFSKLTALEQFDASSNDIIDISSQVFLGLNALNSINLSNNKLSTENFLQTVHSLRYLNMGYNRFETMNLTLFFHFHNVELMGNPWSCTWLIEEMMSASEGIHFGKNYSVDAHDHLITVPGIDCTDESGKLRSIVVLQVPVNRRNSYSEDMVIEEKTAAEEAAILERNKSIRRMIGKEFDYKACLIWTAIAVIAVFGIVHLGKVLFARSEISSEKYRLSQQMSLLSTVDMLATTQTSANTDNKGAKKPKDFC